MKIKNAVPPIKALKLAAVIIALLIIAVSSIIRFVPNPPVSNAADAVNLISTGVYDAPAQGINIKASDIFYTTKYEFSTTNSAFQRNENWVAYEGNKEDFIVYKGVIGDAVTKIPGSFTLLWRNILTDNNGRDCDLKLTVSNVELRFTGTSSHRDYGQAPLIGVEKNKKVIYAHAGDRWWTRFDIRIDILETGTQTPAAGYYMSGVKDIDIPNRYYTPNRYDDDFSEQIQLLSNYGNTAYVNPQYSQHLLIKDNNTTFRGAHSDDDTWDTGVVFSLSANGGTFRWAGSYQAGSTLLYPFEPHIIKASTGAGGTITSAGDTLVGWKNDKTYTITPSPGYRIKEVTVDGTSAGAIATYTFPSVTENHTISATFEKIPYTVTFNDPIVNTTIVSGTLYYGDAPKVLAPTPPEHPGYIFKGYAPSIEDPITGDTEIALIYEPIAQAIIEVEWLDKNNLMEIRPEIAISIPNAKEDISGQEVDSLNINISKDSNICSISYNPDQFLLPDTLPLPDISPYTIECLSAETNIVEGKQTTLYKLRAVYIPTSDVKITKVWDDMDNIYHERPNSIWVDMYQRKENSENDEWTLYDSIEIKESDDGTWSSTVNELPLWKVSDTSNDRLVTLEYKVIEREIYGYDTISTEGNIDTGEIIITNRIWKHIKMPNTGTNCLGHLMIAGLLLIISSLCMLDRRKYPAIH